MAADADAVRQGAIRELARRELARREAERAGQQAAQPQQEATFGDTLGRQLGRTARIGIESVAAIPMAIADAGVGARNLITGSQYQLPSAMLQEGLDNVGLPRAEGWIEKGVDFLGQAIVGSRIPGIDPPPAAPNAVSVPKPNAAQQVIQEGQKHGVPVFYDDVTNSAFARRVGVAAEPLGALGTGSGRAKQAEAARTAASRVVDDLMPSTSDDVPELVQKGLQTRLAQFRGTANRLYTRAANALDPKGTVPRTQFDQIIAKELAEQEKLGTLANPDVVNVLQKYAQAPGGNFSLMRNMRSQLADEVSDFYTGRNSAIGQKGVTILRELQEALEGDMAQFAKSSGDEGYSAWKAADGFYRANIVPFREAGFRDLVKTAEPEKAWRYLMAQGTVKSRAIRMYRSLDESGREAVRYGLVKDAMDNATNPQGTFSPARFAKYLEDHENAVNTFFKGRDLQEIKGFQNLMRHVERAGQFAENPPTGQRVIPYLLGGAAFVEPTVVASTAGAGLTVRGLFQTKTGRDLLLKMSRARPGSPAAQRFASEIGKFLAVSTAVAGTGGQESDQMQTTPPPATQ